MTRIAIALVAIWARVAHAAPALAPRPEIDAPLPAPLTYVWPLDHAPGHAPHLALDFGAVRCARLQDDGLRIIRLDRAESEHRAVVYTAEQALAGMDSGLELRG